MRMDDRPWQPSGDSEDRADPDMEWAFFGVHDIEYWVVRDGRLVPADASELERIAEGERERAAQARLLRWEREQRYDQRPGVIARFVAWCHDLARHPQHVPATKPPVVERSGDGTPHRRSDVARR